MAFQFDSKCPTGPIEDRWNNHCFQSKLVNPSNRRKHSMADRKIVRIGNVEIGGPKFTVIAGPCSIESENQFKVTANSVKTSGASVLRGGIWKMRTSLKSFQGLGEESFQFIKKVSHELS